MKNSLYIIFKNLVLSLAIFSLAVINSSSQLGGIPSPLVRAIQDFDDCRAEVETNLACIGIQGQFMVDNGTYWRQYEDCIFLRDHQHLGTIYPKRKCELHYNSQPPIAPTCNYNVEMAQDDEDLCKEALHNATGPSLSEMP